MSGMRAIRVLLALTAVMVVVGGQAALGANGDPVLAGLVTTATAQTSITTTQSTGVGLQIFMTAGSTSTAPAIRGQNNGSGAGVAGVAASADNFGVTGLNTATKHGVGAAGGFTGGQNDGVRGTTANDAASGVFGRNTANGSGVFGQSSGGNGVFGKTNSSIASGVYGENNGAGFGVAGRSNQANGIGLYGEALGGGNAHAIVGVANTNGAAATISNTSATGPALELHSSGPPMTVDSSTKVDNLNADMVDGHHSSDFLSTSGKAADADKLDGMDSSQFFVTSPGSNARLKTNVLFPATAGQVILDFPNLGANLRVLACNSGKAQLTFSTPDPNGGPAFTIMSSGSFFNNNNHSPESATAWDTLHLEIPATGAAQRGTFTVNVQSVNTKHMITIWVSWDANNPSGGCIVMAQAIEAIGS